MRGPTCPSDPELLAWLRDPFAEHRQPLTAHIDSCSRCQNQLERIDRAEEVRAAAEGDDLLEDLRSEPPADELEIEPTCAAAAFRAAASGVRPPREKVLSQPDASDVRALAQQGRYEILEVLGQGGMGVVYKARNLKMNRLVAIKMLPPVKSQDPSAVARFRREVEAASRLRHPHIVAAHDADEADGKHFLVMEFIDGRDLKSLVREKGPLPVAQTLDLVLQVARGLRHAHEQGIVHRDIKPGNLMLDQNNTVKVLDLGLARIDTLSSCHADLTETGQVMGTIDYLAPEQAAGSRNIDGRADIYSLGCVLYYLLTGKPLYDGDTAIQKVLAHREQPLPSLRKACPACPPFLERVFARMAAKLPEQRYRSMAALIEDLELLQKNPMGPEVPWPARVLEGSLGFCRRGWGLLVDDLRLRWGFAGLLLIIMGWLLGPTLVRTLRPLPDGGAPEDWRGNGSGMTYQQGTGDTLIPQAGHSLAPGRWYDLLQAIPLGGNWKRTSDGLFQAPPVENAVIQVPFEIRGSYQLISSFTRNSGERSINYYFPVGSQVGTLYLDVDNVDSLVVDGRHGLESPARTTASNLETGQRYALLIRVTLQDETATIDVELDGKPHLTWTGALSRLPGFTTSGRFALGSRDGDAVFHTLQVRPSDPAGFN